MINAALHHLLHVLGTNLDRSPWARANDVRDWVDGAKDELDELESDVAVKRWDRAEVELGDVLLNVLTLALVVERASGRPILARAMLLAVEKLRRRKPWLLDPSASPPATVAEEMAIWTRIKGEEPR